MNFTPTPQNISNNPYVEAHFGGNYLANSDRVTEQGTFDEAVTAIGLEALRYPGGALTEQNLGILTPEEGEIIDRETGEPIDITEISDFTAYAEEQDLAVTFVLPTRVFVGEETDENGDRFAQVDEEAVRHFVTQATDGSLGGMPRIQAFEIGNEYWGAGEMSAVEYGRVASDMATIIDDQLNQVPNAQAYEDTDILVQMGTNYGSSNLSDDFEGTPQEQLAAVNETYGLSLPEDKFIYADGDVAWSKVANEVLINEFDEGAEKEAVDGVVAHVYSRGEDTPYSRYFELSQVNDTWLEDNPDLKVYATEWNLKRTVDPTRDEEYGLKQAHEMLNVVEAFDWGNVDAAHVWPVQMASRTGLTGVEGEEAVDVPGEMFRLMSETLPGTRPLDLKGSQGRETELQGETADVHSFWAEDRFVTFLASNSDETTEQIVDFQNLVTDPGEMAITRLGVEEGENPTASDSPPKVTEETPGELFEDGMLITDLAPQEILMIEMTNPTYTDEVQAQAASLDLPDDGSSSGGSDDGSDGSGGDLPTGNPGDGGGGDEPESPEAAPPEPDDGGGGGGEAALLLALGALPLLLLGG